MTLSLRVKMVVLTVLILSLAIGSNVVISGLFFHREYSEALRAEIAVIAQSLKLQLDRLFELGLGVEDLTGFERQCLELLERYDKLSYAFVEDMQDAIS